MATSLGWILGRFLLPNLAILTVGLSIGILQWVILRQRLSDSWGWVLATAVGISLASLFNLVFIPTEMSFSAGFVLGICVGAAQWLIIRTKVEWSGWWIVINIVAWTTGIAFISGFLSTGALVGSITGIALELLLRYPKQQMMIDE